MHNIISIEFIPMVAKRKILCFVQTQRKQIFHLDIIRFKETFNILLQINIKSNSVEYFLIIAQSRHKEIYTDI